MDEKEKEEKEKADKVEGRHPSCQNLRPNIIGVSQLMGHLPLAAL